MKCPRRGMVWPCCASYCAEVIAFAHVVSYDLIFYHVGLLSVYTLGYGEQSCEQGFQPWEMVDATGWTFRNRQYIVPSLNFSCGGVISSWVLTRSPARNVPVNVGNIIVLQLWRQVAGSTYTLRTGQTHTARTSNAASYVFTESPSMTVSSGDVFGCYVPSGSGLRMGTVTDMPEHTIFRTGARPTEFTAGNARFNASPLITINFSEFLHFK